MFVTHRPYLRLPFDLFRFLPLLVGLVVAPLGSAFAQYSGVDAVISRSIRGRDVLRVDTTIELTAGASVGIAKVKITAPRPSPADRDFVIVYYLKCYQQGGPTTAYRVPVRLAEGKSIVELDIPHVHFADQSARQIAWDIGLIEDGRDIEDKRGRRANDLGFQWQGNTGNYFPAMAAIVGSRESEPAAQKNMQKLADQLFKDAYGKSIVYNSGYASTTVNPSQIAVPVRVLGIAAASADWRSYFANRAWTTSAETAKELAAYPASARALRTYVAAGGTLLIHGVDQVQDMPAIETLLSENGQSSKFSSWDSIKASRQRWWWIETDGESLGADDVTWDPNQGMNQGMSQGMSQGLGQGLGGAESAGYASSMGTERMDNGLTGLGAAHDAALLAETWLHGKWGSQLEVIGDVSAFFKGTNYSSQSLPDYRDQIMQALTDERILSRQVGFGTVYISAKPLGQVPPELLQKTSFISGATGSLVLPGQDTNWFWKNLIRAVGKPPVWIFCAIVTLFGALLGPGLLTFTGRIARRSLMIFLVPVISLLATAAIVLYGVLHEGFDTHLRITSVQHIDVNSGVGFAWSRQNYFSGLPPREGIFLNADTYARPVVADGATGSYPSGTNPREGVDFSITLLQDQQNWRGWLKPRQQQQLLIGHALRMPKLPIKIQRSGKQQVTIENKTLGPLPIVLLRGEGDDYYLAEDLAPSQRVVLEVQDNAAVTSKVAQLMVDLRPSAPPEINQSGSLMDFGFGGTRYINTAAGDNDLLDVTFQQALSDKLSMEHFGFAVLARQSADIEVPIKGKSSESLHLILGTYPW